MAKTMYFLLFLLTALFPKSHAQLPASEELYKSIMEKDSLLFSIGFNQCEVTQFQKLISADFEFYHDKGGSSNKEEFIRNLKNGLCADPGNYQAKRILAVNSIEIFPLYNEGILYGAIQNGEHSFYEKQANQPEQFGSTARFTHLWILENENWKLKRSLSFDHQTTHKTPPTLPFLGDDTAMDNWLKENNIPTLGIGIIEDGKLKQVKVFGALKKDTPAPYNTIFNVASLTKPVTAMVTLKLVSQGKWNLDEPLYHYWTDPNIADDPRNKKITTRFVLSHQSGFSNWRWLNNDHKLRFEFDPGTKYMYSGEGYEYLRKALERKFKKPLQQLARELIFSPLGMNDTDYIWHENTTKSRFATGYDNSGKPYETIWNKTANAADDLHTTLADYGNFLASILDGAGLTADVYQEMSSRQVQTKRNKYFGLGFEIYDLGNGEYALAHGGADVGVQCIFFILPKTKQGILIFTNADEGYKIYDKLLLHYLGDKGKKLIEIETN